MVQDGESSFWSTPIESSSSQPSIESSVVPKQLGLSRRRIPSTSVGSGLGQATPAELGLGAAVGLGIEAAVDAAVGPDVGAAVGGAVGPGR